MRRLAARFRIPLQALQIAAQVGRRLVTQLKIFFQSLLDNLLELGWESTRRTSFIAMELLEGQNLEQRLGSGPLPLDRLLDVGIQLADAA